MAEIGKLAEQLRGLSSESAKQRLVKSLEKEIDSTRKTREQLKKQKQASSAAAATRKAARAAQSREREETVEDREPKRRRREKEMEALAPLELDKSRCLLCRLPGIHRGPLSELLVGPFDTAVGRHSIHLFCLQYSHGRVFAKPPKPEESESTVIVGADGALEHQGAGAPAAADCDTPSPEKEGMDVDITSVVKHEETSRENGGACSGNEQLAATSPAPLTNAPKQPSKQPSKTQTKEEDEVPIDAVPVNVAQIVEDGWRRAPCTVCKLPGATIKCSHGRCQKYYHVSCAHAVGMQYTRQKRAVCQNHAPASQETVSIGAPKCNICNNDRTSTQILTCTSCLRRFHPSCVELPIDLQPEHAEDWQCADCKHCELCDVFGGEKDEEMVICDKCDRGYHYTCLTPPLPGIPEGRFVCPRCAECRCCGRRKPGNGENAMWQHDYTMCVKCARQYDKNCYCPTCEKTYTDDTEGHFIQCDSCDRWVHQDCAELTDDAIMFAGEKSSFKFHCMKCIITGKAGKKKTVDLFAKLKGMEQAAGKASRMSAPSVREADTLPNKNTPAVAPAGTTAEPAGNNQEAGAMLPSELPLSASVEVETDAPLEDLKLCGVCSSATQEPDRYTCFECCETYHSFCLDHAPTLRPDHKDMWRCHMCNTCSECSEAGHDDVLLVCDVCERAQHTFCAVPKLTTVPDGGWRCQSCTQCESCGTRSPGHRKDSQWMLDYRLCETCYSLRQKGKACHHCGKSYHTMSGAGVLKCTVCLRNTHAECDGVEYHSWCELASEFKSQYVCKPCLNKDNGKRPVVLDDARYQVHAVMELVQCVQSCRKKIRADVLPGIKPREVLFDICSMMMEQVDSIQELRKAIGYTKPAQGHLVGDERACFLCGGLEELPRKRLIYALDGNWVHFGCALWSSGVLNTDGILTRLSSLRRSHKCKLCDKTGATVGCWNRSCKKMYHVECAMKDGCGFTNNPLRQGEMYCRQHIGSKVVVQDFDALHNHGSKWVVIKTSSHNKSPDAEEVNDNDSLSGSDTDSQGDTFMDNEKVLIVGGLQVLSFGALEDHCVYHTQDFIYPNGYSSWRRYWSFKKPFEHTTYRFTIERVGRVTDDPQDCHVFHLVADDAKDESFVGRNFVEVWERLVSHLKSIYRDLRLSTSETRGAEFVGLAQPTVKRRIESMPWSARCKNYRFTFGRPKLSVRDMMPPENPTGCVRTEQFSRSRTFDRHIFSIHRSFNMKTITKPELIREPFNLDQALTQRYKVLKQNGSSRLKVLRSHIHAWGLFATDNFAQDEMVVEYLGEVISPQVCEYREKRYDQNGIGCYMFRIDQDSIIDATTTGNCARYINHCCEPNCYSKVVLAEGKKHIVIFALKPIMAGQEITYDYKFPIEDEKIPCTCGAPGCRKTLN